MPVDVSTEDDAYVIRAAVPGLKPEEVEIQIHDDIVLLRGTPKAEEAEERDYLMREMGPADFERRLRLPEAVNAVQGRGNDREWVADAAAADRRGSQGQDDQGPRRLTRLTTSGTMGGVGRPLSLTSSHVSSARYRPLPLAPLCHLDARRASAWQSS